MRTDEADFIHTAVRIRPRPKNKPAFWPVDPPCARYTRIQVRFQPPDCVPDIPPTPDILHGSYLGQAEQSPASSHNTPCFPHRRFVSIAGWNPYVKKFFVLYGENFSVFLCTPTKIAACAPRSGPAYQLLCPRVSSPPGLVSAGISMPSPVGTSIARPPIRDKLRTMRTTSGRPYGAGSPSSPAGAALAAVRRPCHPERSEGSRPRRGVPSSETCRNSASALRSFVGFASEAMTSQGRPCGRPPSLSS